MRDFGRAVVLALLLGVLVAVGAYLTAPQRQSLPPTPFTIPLSGEIPSTLASPIEPDYNPICGTVPCESR
jgi:hypothetical protein